MPLFFHKVDMISWDLLSNEGNCHILSYPPLLGAVHTPTDCSIYGYDILVIVPLFRKTLRTFPAPEIPIGLDKASTVTESFLNCSILLPLPSWVLRSCLFLRKLPASESSTHSVVDEKPHWRHLVGSLKCFLSRLSFKCGFWKKMI